MSADHNQPHARNWLAKVGRWERNPYFWKVDPEGNNCPTSTAS